jgi:hypothetical protein
VRTVGLIAAGLALLPAACVRDTVGECADIGAGELVVTELRGPQTADELTPPFVELYNTTNRTLDLEGLKMRWRTIDGGTDIPVLVRRSVTVAGGSYIMLGLVPDDLELPSYLDYGFSSDYKQGYLTAAAIDLISCELLIDRMVYRSLPKDGTYSFEGTPSAEANDDEAQWCTNPLKDGSPRMANPPCP